MRVSLIEYSSNSPEDTIKIGQYIAAKILTTKAWRKNNHNFIIALNGELGSGKTQITKGIASGLGIEEIITSPTYTIINQYDFNLAPNETELNRMKTDEIPCTLYPVPCPLFHIDAYRLNDEKEFLEIGGEEILSTPGICVIEWAEKIKQYLPAHTINIKIEFLPGDSRKITIEGIDK